MGCDIHTFVEVLGLDGHWEYAEEIDINRSYSLFGLLADVRNYSATKPIVPRRGFPEDVSEDVERYSGSTNTHSHTWYLLSELLDFDWQQLTEDRRYTQQTGPNFFNGGATCEPGKGAMETYAEMAGEFFSDVLPKLKATYKNPKEVRLLFCFDS